MTGTLCQRRVASAFLMLIWALTALPPAALVLLVAHHWVDVPWMDEWDISDVISRYHEGTLQLKYLIAQHNEHRPLVMRSITVVLSLINRWDLRWEMALSLFLASATFAGIARLHYLMGGPSRLRTAVVLMVTSLVVFSPAQWANWLWGMQFAAFIPSLFLVVGLLISVSRHSVWLKSAVNSVLACLATYSFAHGMALWVLIFPRDFINLARRRAAKRSGWTFPLLWYAAAGVATVTLYFHDYRQAPGMPPLTHSLSHPAQALTYYLSWLGDPLVPDGSVFGSTARAIVGGCTLVIFVLGVVLIGRSTPYDEVSTRRPFAIRRYPWAMMGACSLLSGAVITIGRSGFGLDQAAESRYVTFSLFLTVASISFAPELFARWMRRGRWPLRLGTAAQTIAIMIVLLLHELAVSASERAMSLRSDRLRQAKVALCLHRVVTDSELLGTLYPNGSHVASAFARLKSHGQLNYDALALPDFVR